MIECTENYIWYKKRKKKPFKRFFSFLLIILFLTSLILYYNLVILKQIFAICADYTYTYSTESVNSAVMLSLESDIKYSDLITVEKNGSGDIVLMTTNSLKVNTINREVASTTSSLLKHKLSKGIPVPLLAFTGISFLSGYGSNVNLKTTNNVGVLCGFSSRFTAVGINQTLHSIYLDVEITVNIKVPFNNHQEKCFSQILISETILVGKVPDIYLKEGVFT